MSKTSKHIEWCFNKAKKEIEECKKMGKRIKHRGLLKIKPDITEAKKHINKAVHNLNAITDFKNIGYSDWSISAGFYCIYQCFLAIAIKFGYESRNQTCTLALIENLKEEGKININENFIDILKEADIGVERDKIIEMREDYTYGVKISVEDETKINELIKNCKEMIDITKDIVFK